MLSVQDIYDIQKLDLEEQNVIFSLVRSFLVSKEDKNEAQKFLADTRKKYLDKNPMTMEEIDKIIHDIGNIKHYPVEEMRTMLWELCQ